MKIVENKSMLKIMKLTLIVFNKCVCLCVLENMQHILLHKIFTGYNTVD